MPKKHPTMSLEAARRISPGSPVKFRAYPTNNFYDLVLGDGYVVEGISQRRSGRLPGPVFRIKGYEGRTHRLSYVRFSD